jgi:hypothetical protein
MLPQLFQALFWLLSFFWPGSTCSFCYLEGVELTHPQPLERPGSGEFISPNVLVAASLSFS